MPGYVLSAYKLSDFSGSLADPANASTTVGDHLVGTSVALTGQGALIDVAINDDDTHFEDAFMETAGLSTLASDLVIDGVTYPAGSSNIECEFLLTTNDQPPVSFYIGRIGTGTSNSGENLLVFTDSPLVPGQTYSFVATQDAAWVESDTVCFAAGTMIDTPRGPVAVEDLGPGERVLTRDSGARPVLWAGQRRLSGRDLARAPHLAPIRFRAGSLGPGLPGRDLVLSPQHRVVIDDWRAEHYFGETSVLAPAKALVNTRSVTIDRGVPGVTYCHILLEQHELVRANGHWAETLLLGPQARKALGDAQIAEIEQIFPELLDSLPTPACPIVGAREAVVLSA